MSERAVNPRVGILQMCAAALPGPWYPRLAAQSQGLDLSALIEQLEELWLQGLIEKTPGSSETGPAITLTSQGQEVLQDPEAIDRMNRGLPARVDDHGARIRQRLSQRRPPWAARLYLIVGLLVFGGELALLWQRNVPLEAFLLPSARAQRDPRNVFARIQEVLHDSGALQPEDVVEKQWWRFLTASFVHAGLLHVVLGLMTVYLVGRTVEQMWGPLGCGLLLVFSGMGGLVAAVAHRPGVELGSSAMWAGLCVSEAVWLLLHRRHLTQAMRRQVFIGVSSTLFMLLLFSFLPGTAMDTWGLAGGAVSAVFVALVLHLHERLPAPACWPALALVLVLPWSGYLWLQHVRSASPAWEAVEDSVFEKRYLPLVQRTSRAAWKRYHEDLQPILETHPERRQPEEVEKAGPIVVEGRAQLGELDRVLSRAGPYHSRDSEDARQAALGYTHALAELYALADSQLRQGASRSSRDRQALAEQAGRVERAARDWQALLEPAGS